MNREDIISELDELTSDYRFVKVLSTINLVEFCSNLSTYEKKPPFEIFNYNEYKFLLGLWLKNHSNKTSFIKDYDIAENYQKVHDLMESFHQTYIPKLDLLEHKLSFSEIMIDGDKFKEAFFYSGVGAYDDQYAKFAVDKYKLDEEWIKINKGFSIHSLTKFFDNVRSRMNEKLNDKVLRKSLVPVEGPLKLFCLTKDEIVSNNKDFEIILEHLSTEYGSELVNKLDDIGDYNAIVERPIVKLKNDKYFVSIPFSIAETIYKTPFYWMIKDASYRSKSADNRGKVGEDITYSILSKIYGENNVFKGVDIKKKKSETTTDIDVLVIHDNVGIVFQIKSKKLTGLSKQGDITSIRDDFNKAVESAFLQGKECKKCILESNNYKFLNNKIDDITERIETIEDVYVMCVVLDEFPAIAHAAQVLLYDKYPESTIAISVLDLDMICQILKTSKRVTDYLTKRINNCRYYHSDSEASFLGYYVSHDLKPASKVNGAYLDPTFAHKLNRIYYEPFFKKNIKPANERKVGRNDDCPCGSGKKHKKCCLLKV